MINRKWRKRRASGQALLSFTFRFELYNCNKAKLEARGEVWRRYVDT